MPSTDPDRPRTEHPRYEPEIIPPGETGRRPGFESVFIRMEEGPDGIRRVTLKRPGPFTIALILLIAGLIVALLFLALSAFLLFWIPIVIGGIVIAVFFGTARYYWQRVRSWFGR